MPSVTRNAFLLFCVACLLVVGSSAQAASVVWTIDSTATVLGVSATGQAPISGLTLPLRIVIQGTNPLPSLTPTLPVYISGSLVTDTDFTSSIKFLKTGTLEGEPTGSYEPDPSGVDDTFAPADVGSGVQAKLGSFVNVADAVLRNMDYDFSAPGAIAITGGSFPTTTASVSTVNGDLDYRGYGPGAGLGSGTTEVDRLLPGDANYDRIVDGGDYTIWADNFDPGGSGNQFYQGDFSGDGIVDGGDYTLWADNYLDTDNPFDSGLNTGAAASISKVGLNYVMTIPLVSKVYFPIDDGAGSDTTTDDIFVYLDFVGTIVATTPIPADASAIPEPSTFALSLIAGLGMAVVGLHRKLRRRA